MIEDPPNFIEVEDSWDEDDIDGYMLRKKLRHALNVSGNVMTDEERDVVEEALEEALAGAGALASSTVRGLPPCFENKIISDEQREMLALALAEGQCAEFMHYTDPMDGLSEVEVCITLPRGRIDG